MNRVSSVVLTAERPPFMKLSRESEYGIQGLIHLAQQPPGTVMQLATIAEAQGLPQSFLAKIFQKDRKSVV